LKTAVRLPLRKYEKRRQGERITEKKKNEVRRKTGLKHETSRVSQKRNQNKKWGKENVVDKTRK